MGGGVSVPPPLRYAVALAVMSVVVMCLMLLFVKQFTSLL